MSTRLRTAMLIVATVSAVVLPSTAAQALEIGCGTDGPGGNQLCIRFNIPVVFCGNALLGQDPNPCPE